MLLVLSIYVTELQVHGEDNGYGLRTRNSLGLERVVLKCRQTRVLALLCMIASRLGAGEVELVGGGWWGAHVQCDLTSLMKSISWA